MSEVHSSKVSGTDSVASNDYSCEKKIDIEKVDVNKSKCNKDEDDLLMTKGGNGKKKQKNGSEANTSEKKSDVVVNNDVIIGHHDDRNSVPSNEAKSNCDKLENNGEKKTPTTKGEKSMKKKKTQKENSSSNGNVKEEGEKKKKKKRKKKKGGGGDDELAKIAKDGEASSTAANGRNDNKNTSEKIENMDNDIILMVPKSEHGDNIIKKTGDNCKDTSSRTDEVLVINGNSGENIPSGSCNNQDKNKSEEKAIDVDIQEKIKRVMNKNDTESPQSTILEASRKNIKDESQNDKNTDKNELSNGVENSVNDSMTHADGAEKSLELAEPLVENADNLVYETESSVDGTKNSVDGTEISIGGTENSVDGTENSVEGTENSVITEENSIDEADNSVKNVDNSFNKIVNLIDRAFNLDDWVDNSAERAENLTERADTMTEMADNLTERAHNSKNSNTRSKETFIKKDNLLNQTPAKYRDDASETANFLDTIIESDELSAVNDEDKEKEFPSYELESDNNIFEKKDDVRHRNDVTGRCMDNTYESVYRNKDTSESVVDTSDGVGIVDCDMDNNSRTRNSRKSINHMTNEQLHERLQEQNEAMTKLQTFTHSQQVKLNLLTTSLRAKLRRKEQELRIVQSEHEQQVSAVLSYLLYLEGQMQKEHNELYEILLEKNDIIRRQKAAIEDLAAKNNGYLQALKESHGFATDNGLVEVHIVEKNENISIQDHGNKIILRGHKNKNGEKTQLFSHKVRFGAMKDRLRRHKSSFELYHNQSLETLKEANVKFGSEENLVVHRNSKMGLLDRKERCRSLIEYPAYLFDVEEGQTEAVENCFSDDFSTPTIPRHDSTSSLVNLSETRGIGGLSSNSMFGFNELSKSRSVPHALPTVAENDTSPTSLRGRPHSLPSVEVLAKEVVATATATTPIPTSNSKVPQPSTTSSSSPPSESNPFKTFKNVFKRKGSSKKKRAAAVTSGKEQTDVLKQHFKKYDMT